jgi:hypothetical protein
LGAAAEAGPRAPAPSLHLPAGDGPPLAKLQRIVKLSNLDGRGRLDQPPPAELQDALQQGLAGYSRLSASPASPLMAVAKGTWVALVDLTSHAAEMAAGSIAPGTPGGGAVQGPSGGSGGGSRGQTTLVRHNARFHVLGVALDQASARHLAVAGLRDLELWVLEAKGKVADRLVLGLPFDASERGPLDLVSRVEWLPGSDTWLAVRRARLRRRRGTPRAAPWPVRPGGAGRSYLRSGPWFPITRAREP